MYFCMVFFSVLTWKTTFIHIMVTFRDKYDHRVQTFAKVNTNKCSFSLREKYLSAGTPFEYSIWLPYQQV